MSSKQSPGKIPLSKMKGKPIVTSVPIIRYHANDDELEELYPSTDDDDMLSPESDHSLKSSLYKSNENKTEDTDNVESNLEKQSASMDDSLSEGTPPSDPWKMLSEIKGKITKTFEEKLSEMKSDKKKHKHRSRENSSVSDSEDLGDVTPTEENASENQEKESPVVNVYQRRQSSRFTGFSHIKTGLKTKNSEEDSIESGIEAAELVEDLLKNTDEQNEQEGFQDVEDSVSITKEQCNVRRLLLNDNKSSEQVLTQLKNQIMYQLVVLPIVLWCSYYVALLPEYFMGLCAGMYIAVIIQNIVACVVKFLTTPQERKTATKSSVPVLEILAVEEHAVIERFEGWLNELPYNYEPDNYHVARTKPVFFRLEGETLRVTEIRNRIPKRAVWDEPKHKVRFTRKRVYSLVDAKIELLPDGLIRRRRWSKKYPICITFQKDALIESTVLKESTEDEALSVDADSESKIIEEEETDEDLSQSRDIKDVLEDYDDNDDTKLKIFVFARTDRQKEDWFRRLMSVVNLTNKRNSSASAKDLTLPLNTSLTSQTVNDSKNSSSSAIGLEIPPELNCSAYMARYIDTQSNLTTGSTSTSMINDVTWINALLGRILFDVHKCSDTISLIQDKIQRKLSNIKLPYYMESLHVSELVIGQGAPVIHKVAKPVIDDRGLWLELDISYEGCLTMTIETKLNLMKLTRAGSMSSNSNDVLGTDKSESIRSAIFNSDVEDSPETSTEEEDNTNPSAANAARESIPTQSSGRKFFSMVDKLAANKYFQHAAELSYVRRAMEGVSNTEIRLMVSVSTIEGCLALNIPPPPADRLWYGFKPVPKISLTAKPAVGERAVNIVYVTKWIETKLLREFEKVVVLPNMDDLIIPLCPNYPYIS